MLLLESYSFSAISSASLILLEIELLSRGLSGKLLGSVLSTIDNPVLNNILNGSAVADIVHWVFCHNDNISQFARLNRAKPVIEAMVFESVNCGNFNGVIIGKTTMGKEFHFLVSTEPHHLTVRTHMKFDATVIKFFQCFAHLY